MDPDNDAMRIDPDDYRVHHRHRVRLDRWPTRVAAFYRSEEAYEAQLAHDKEELSERQQLLAADGRYSLLLVLQAMDAAGKDGVIAHVMSGVNPQGCHVASFKAPSSEELAHDFLWRAVLRLPRRGEIGIFNRSYYEEVLVVRVHPTLLEAQHLPEACRGKGLWKERYRSIRHFEEHLTANGTVVVKIFLHLSKEEQRQRFLSRLEKPDKTWKFSLDDARERAFWDDYQDAYARCIEATSTRTAPWYIVPADDKRDARLILSAILLRHLHRLDLAYPQPDRSQRRELARIRQQLERE